MPESGPETASAVSGAKRGNGRSGHRRRREIPFRDIGRKVVLFAAANSLVSLFLPWVQTSRGSINAFGLRSSSLSILGMQGIAWVGVAVWFVPLGAAVAAAIAAIDRKRPTGMLLPYAALAAGGWMVLLAGHVFETCPLLRQLGVVACGIGGLAFVGGGAILLEAKWRPAPKATTAGSAGSRLARLPWASVAILTICAGVHALLSLDAARERAWTLDCGLIAGSLKGHALLTHVFLHGDWLHLAANAAVLLAVGSVLERRVGRAVFVAVFLAAGVAGGVASAALDPRIHSALVGSSGAVAGCVGLCLVAAPRARVNVWIHAGLAAAKLKLQAAWLFSAWMLLQAVGSVYLSMGETDSTAYWAHLGGMAAGIAGGAGLRALGRVAPEEESPDGPPADKGTNRGVRRITRRERACLKYMPHALVSVATVVSAVAAALTFHPGSIERSLASFQRAWNSGDLDRVSAFFREESRPELRARLEELARRLDPGAGDGRTDWRIALSRARRDGEDVVAVFMLSPPGEDPFRAKKAAGCGRRLRALFRREFGAWRVRAAGVGSVH